MAIKLNDLAQRAGVSRSVVSRMFTDVASVSKVMRQKVEDAAIEPGYMPNFLARSLTIRSTKLIGLVSNNFHNPIFLEVFDQFTRGLQDCGLRLLIWSICLKSIRHRPCFVCRSNIRSMTLLSPRQPCHQRSRKLSEAQGSQWRTVLDGFHGHPKSTWLALMMRLANKLPQKPCWRAVTSCGLFREDQNRLHRRNRGCRVSYRSCTAREVQRPIVPLQRLTRLKPVGQRCNGHCEKPHSPRLIFAVMMCCVLAP